MTILSCESTHAVTPMEWFESNRPIPWGGRAAIVYKLEAPWDGNKEYRTHVTVSQIKSGSQFNDYKIALAMGQSGTASWARIRMYSHHPITPRKLKGKIEATLMHIEANPAELYDISYIDKHGKTIYSVKKRGTFIVSAFNAIFSELEVDKALVFDTSHRYCRGGSRYDLVFHRLWQEKDPWYTEFEYYPLPQFNKQISKAKRKLFKMKLSDLYKIGDWTFRNSEKRIWRERFQQRIATDLGVDVRDNVDQTLKQVMQRYVAGMQQNNNICMGYVQMMNILHQQSRIRLLLETIEFSNAYLYHGPFT